MARKKSRDNSGDMPRSFIRAMQYQTTLQQKIPNGRTTKLHKPTTQPNTAARLPRTKHTSNSASKPIVKPTTKPTQPSNDPATKVMAEAKPHRTIKLGGPRPNESMEIYAKRLDTECRIRCNKAASSSTNKAQKRKAYLTTRKLISKVKANNDPNDQAGQFYKSVGKEGLVEVIPFGTQVLEPPKFKILPKPKLREYVEKIQDEPAAASLSQSASTTNQNSMNPKRKHKLKSLSLADRARMLKERASIIDHYRAIKKTRVYAQEEDDDDDEDL